MNPAVLGDSYDLVKRFFCHELSAVGYEVIADPMFTGVWLEQQQPGFLRLIGASSEVEANHLSSLTALFLDPILESTKRVASSTYRSVGLRLRNQGTLWCSRLINPSLVKPSLSKS